MRDLLTRFDVARVGSRHVSRRDVLRYSAGASLAAIVLPLLAGCGGDDDDDSDATAPPATSGSGSAGATVKTTLTDTSITLSPTSVSAGSIIFEVTNSGTKEHEFVVIKTDADEGSLPMDSTKDEVDEVAAGPSPGEIEGIAAGETKSVTFDLTAGKYVLICNLEGHYTAGMHTTLDVT